MKPRLRVRDALACAALLAACATAPTESRTAPPEDPDIVHLTIVGTNDLHGWLEPHESEHPGDPAVLGGIDTFGGYLDVLRAQRPDSVILLDAGDLFQGTLLSDETEGSAVIKAYDALRYDAVAVGNHEFDFGPEGAANVARNPDEDPLGAIKARMRDANFPFLAGNIVLKGTDDPVAWGAQRTIMIHRHGVAVGIIGLTTPTTPTVTLAANVAGLDFKPLAPEAQALAAELRDHGAQIVVLVAHAGGSCPLGNDPHDLTHCDGGEIFPLLEALPPGTLDAVVAGHTHQYMASFVNGIPVIESKAYGEAFGVIDLSFNRRTGKTDPTATRIWHPVPICRFVHSDTNSCGRGSGPWVPPTFLGEAISPDTDVADAIAPDIARVTVQRNEKLGPQLNLPLLRSRTAESALGDIVADVLRGVIPGADIGVVNSGGLRADIGSGSITYGRVFNALPFDNSIAVLKLTGAEVVALIARGLSGEHGVLQTSGLRIEAVDSDEKPCVPGGSRVVRAVLEDGTPIDPARSYTVVTNDFVAGGGDGYDSVLGHVDPSRIQIRYDLPPLREEVVAYFRFHPDLTGPLKLAHPRLAYAKPACGSARSP